MSIPDLDELEGRTTLDSFREKYGDSDKKFFRRGEIGEAAEFIHEGWIRREIDLLQKLPTCLLEGMKLGIYANKKLKKLYNQVVKQDGEG